MSNSVIPDVSKVPMLKNCFGITAKYPALVKLFKNDAIISNTTVKAELTEADFSGYAAESLVGAAVSGTLDADGRALCAWTAVQFTKSGATANSVYGYWVEDVDGFLLWVEKFDAPIVMNLDGIFITLTVKSTGGSEFSNQ